MKALYYNMLEAYSTIAMTNGDSNYPITNIFSTMGTLYSKTTAGSTVITITFASDQSADMFCLAFTNIIAASTIAVVYKNAGGATIFTDNLVKDNFYIVKSYFTKLTTVRSIIITITNGAAIAFYFGTIWIGESVTLPDVQSKQTQGLKGFSGFQKSTTAQVFGQTSGLFGKWQINIPLIFTQTIMDSIKTYLAYINNLPHFIDFHEGIEENIFYCHYTDNDASWKKQNDVSLKYRDHQRTIEECF